MKIVLRLYYPGISVIEVMHEECVKSGYFMNKHGAYPLLALVREPIILVA